MTQASVDADARAIFEHHRGDPASSWRGVDWDDLDAAQQEHFRWDARFARSEREFAGLPPHLPGVLRREGYWDRATVRDALERGVRIAGVGTRGHAALMQHLANRVRCPCCDGTGWRTA